MNALSSLFRRLSRVNLDDSLDKLRPADVLMICHDANHGLMLEGRAYSPLMDSVRELLEGVGYSCAKVAWQFSKLTGERAHGAPRALNRSYLVAAILSQLRRLSGRGAGWRRPIVNLHRRILGAVKPRLVISIGSSPELAVACHEMGVRHAELMHGMGYPFIPWGWDRLPEEALPTDILALDRKSSEVFGALADKGVAVQQVPHPFLERFAHGIPAGLPQEWCLPMPDKAKAYEKRVLVALSWGYAGDHGGETDLAGILDNGLYPDVVAQMIEETAENVFWTFRLHPVQLRQPDRYGSLVERLDVFCRAHANTEWEWGSTVPLPVALHGVDGVATMASMSCYDAAAMQVSSLALCPTLRGHGKYRDLFAELVADGYVTKANWSPEPFREWLSSIPHTVGPSAWQSEGRNLGTVLKELIDAR